MMVLTIRMNKKELEREIIKTKAIIEFLKEQLRGYKFTLWALRQEKKGFKKCN